MAAYSRCARCPGTRWVDAPRSPALPADSHWWVGIACAMGHPAWPLLCSLQSWFHTAAPAGCPASCPLQAMGADCCFGPDGLFCAVSKDGSVIMMVRLCRLFALSICFASACCHPAFPARPFQPPPLPLHFLPACTGATRFPPAPAGCSARELPAAPAAGGAAALLHPAAHERCHEQWGPWTVLGGSWSRRRRAFHRRCYGWDAR